MGLLDQILLEKRLIYIDTPKPVEEKRRAYLNSYLLVNFGIELENPECVNDEVLQKIDALLRLNVPSSFYESPQDTKYFSCEELFLEQVFSYWLGYGTPIKRIELFPKVIPPKCIVGEEMHLRSYRIVSKEEAEKTLREAASNYCAYKRPYSEIESLYVSELAKEGYINEEDTIQCRDNIFLFLPRFPSMMKRLDKKDLVKYSLDVFGDTPPTLTRTKTYQYVQAHKILSEAIDVVRDCPLSKRQAKLFNKLCKVYKGHKGKETNAASPYKKLNQLIAEDKIIEAADFLAERGSILERNLKYLLSRAKDDSDVSYIIDKLSNKNPTALFQILSTLSSDAAGSPRTFVYIAHKKTVSYVETKEEATYRKSVLPPYILEQVKILLLDKICSYYRSLPSLGRIYLSEQFRKVAIPVNTSSSGRGVDVLPSGSRIPFSADYIRTFCYWHGVRDIDASLAFLREKDFNGNGSLGMDRVLSWRTYRSKAFGDDALCSGDDTSTDGAEYQDLNITKLCKRGFDYAIAAINGYGGKLDQGKIYQGLQIKENIDTRPWDPKNIEFQMNVVGNSLAFTGFAVDLRNKEIVIINRITPGNRLMGRQQLVMCRRYLQKDYLYVNMYEILSCRGRMVDDPKDADVVFDAEYQSATQKVIRPFDVDSLIALVNEKPERN